VFARVNVLPQHRIGCFALRQLVDEVIDLHTRRLLEHVSSEHQRIERGRKTLTELVVLTTLLLPQGLFRLGYRFVFDFSLLVELRGEWDNVR
jgi:hypothetical protein